MAEQGNEMCARTAVLAAGALVVALSGCVTARTETTTEVRQGQITAEVVTLCNLMNSPSYAKNPSGRAALAAELRALGVDTCPDKQERVAIETHQPPPGS